jgi:hypothetical protein
MTWLANIPKGWSSIAPKIEKHYGDSIDMLGSHDTNAF